MPHSLLNAQHLHRFYADTHAVNDVSIELKQGDILGLLGPNGAGKTSCMQILCGVLAPSAGEISIKGIDLLDRPNQAKRHIGYLPDKPPLYNELSVDEFLDFSARLRQVEKKQIHSLRQQAKRRCGLEQHGQRLIGHLSKGYQQRVGIAQAIIHQPDIIILDEPTVGLDPIQIREIRQLICELGEHHGIILSTHILPEVQAVCNRVQIIHQGQSVFNDSMQNLKQSNQLKLRLQETIDPAELTALPAIDAVQAISKQTFLLSGNTLEQHLSDISQLCVNKGWGLLEISLQENSLEQIFINLSTSDSQHSPSEDAA